MSFNNLINKALTEINETAAERLVRLYPAAEDSITKAEAILLKECVWNQYYVENAERQYDAWLFDIARWGHSHATEKLAAEVIIKSIYAAIVATAAEDKMLIGIQNFNGMPDWHSISTNDVRGDFRPLKDWPDRLRRWDREAAEEKRQEEKQLQQWREGANQYFSDFIGVILSWEYDKIETIHYFVDDDELEMKEISVRRIRASVEAGGKARQNIFKWFVTHETLETSGVSAKALSVPTDKVLELCDYRIPDIRDF